MKELVKELLLIINRGAEFYRVKLYKSISESSMECLIDVKTDNIEDYWHGFQVDGMEYDMNVFTENKNSVASIYNVAIDEAGFTETLTDEYERIDIKFT